MEDKHFQWLCRVLATARARTNVLETVFFHNDAVDFWCITDPSGCVKRRQSSEEGIATYSEALQFFLARQKLAAPRQTGPLCLSCWKGLRTCIEIQQAEEWLTKRESPTTRCTYLQEVRDSRCSLYTFQTKYERGKGYSSLLFRCNGDAREKETNPRLIHKVRDAVQVAISAVERVKTRRVVELELEFIRETDGSLWVSNCLQCQVALPILCQHDILDPDRKSDLKRPTKTQFPLHRLSGSAKETEVKKANGHEAKYVFRRGQLRNKDSNLNSPLRVLSPTVSEHGDGAGEEKGGDLGGKSYQAGGSARSLKSYRFHNPNFQELLLMNFLRRSGLNPRAVTNRDDFQRRMEFSLFNSETELLRSQTSLGRGRIASQREEPTVESSDSDISGASEASLGADKLPEIDVKRVPECTQKAVDLQTARKSKLQKGGKVASAALTSRSERRRPKQLESARKWSKSDYFVPVLKRKRPVLFAF